MLSVKKWLIAIIVLILAASRAPAEEYRLVFHGDWDRINSHAYQSELAEVFDSAYARLYARWGWEGSPETIFFGADADDKDGVAYSYSNHVVVAVDYANHMPMDLGYFVHELTHCIQLYDGKIAYDSDSWWIENMAEYARFRYYHWTDVSRLEPISMYAEDWTDWGYQPYGNCQWFFAYMDSCYPTRRDGEGNLIYGLIDSIHHLILENEGEALDDNPYDSETLINKTVYSVTGYKSVEALRLRFAEELTQGSWQFTGFAGYEDNFITENLTGVANPEYPSAEQVIHRSDSKEAMEPIADGENLCIGAEILSASGFVNEWEAPGKLIDGDLFTKWCSTPEHVTDMTYGTDGARQWIVIDLTEQKKFNSYTVINTKTVEPAQGNMVSWELLVSDDGENWLSVDYQTHCDKDRASFDIGQQNARYLLLRIYDPDNGETGTIRLYELMLFLR